MEKLYEQQEQQKRENVMLRETGRQYLENFNRVEVGNFRKNPLPKIFE